ncbi:hypothetical protein soil367_18675 (plasmid) [Hydrocarboniclastica marina]|uniref:Uncharacterized protein n=1 Tax=Hydrocarboniclastica marina TaxID=2259620 RepID=A0A4P7XLH5_9ALTE|nr:hypothetical protein soil367_18675 [Hydrocarboniclastica marina]
MLWAKLQHLKARHYEAQCQARAIVRKYRRFIRTNDPRTNEAFGVGAHGIRMYAKPSKKTASGWEFGYLVTRGSGSSDRFFPILDEQWRISEAWAMAINFWAELHAIRDQDRLAKLEETPSPDRFKQLRRYLNEQGKDIPTEALGPVYREQREALAREKAKKQLSREELDDELADMLSWLTREIETTRA